MTQIHWLNAVSGGFNTAKDWSTGKVPGAGDEAILDASGKTAYTVTASTNETVDSIQTTAKATLSITAGNFTAGAGTKSGANAGTIAVANGATFSTSGGIDNSGAITLSAAGHTTEFRLDGNTTLSGGGRFTLSNNADNLVAGKSGGADTLTNADNTIAGAGMLGDGDASLTLNNQTAGIVDGDVSAALTIDTGTNTITNAGLIEAVGSGGVTIQSAVTNTGTLEANGGTLTLDGAVTGKGTLAVMAGGVTFGSAASLAGNTVTQSGATTVTVDGNLTYGSNWTQSAGTISVASAGTLNFSANASSFAGTLSGAGTLVFSGGEETLAPGAVVKVSNWSIANGLTKIVLSTNLTYANTFSLTASTVTVGAGDTLTLSGAATVAGTVNGAGALAITTSSLALNAGADLETAQTTIDTPSVTASGTIQNGGTVSITAPDFVIAATGVALANGGTWQFSDKATNEIIGASASATLTNIDNTIEGAGDLGDGQMILLNRTAGTIIGNGAVALIIDTSANVITNSGLIEASGAGGVTVQSAVFNPGVLQASGGDLTLTAAVTGAGSADISAGTLDFMSTFNQNVTFAGTTGTLELAQSQSYKKTVTGFSTTGETSLDLGDIGFVSSTEATFVDNGLDTGGVLTVTDGVNTAKINLAGDYANTTFVASSDGNGGVIVVDMEGADRRTSPAGPSPPHAFIAAMAGLGRAGAAATHPDVRRPAHEPMLAGPRTLQA